ncbi:MAG: NACHT domain-containing NTPase [Xenococcaceae cyanobacterium]
MLGEYGQGKSSAALMFVYHMIELAKQNKVRVPILIELRGKSPRNLIPLEILSSWASQYRIDSQALLRLHIAGRLLLIFEGFDEMELIGNFEARLEHFKRLWEFCYPKAKILITGRPNFFLDDAEMRLSLGISQPTGDNHYCEAIRLAPFSIKQIEKSLRQQKSEIREQISTVAKNNSRFRDLVARPSLLHVVSVIWEQENLGDKIESLNSAYVMERFVKYSYRRQGLKAGNYKDESRKYFMALNTSEREYFMSGIAAYMASKKLGNQISAGELNNLIENLINVIPDSVSTSVSVISGEERRPLKIRMAKDSQEYIEHIKTDVRTCGLLVDDPAVPGTFKFGHKSFMEYLFASVIADSIIKSDKQDTQAILKTTKARIDKITKFPVSTKFLSEIIIQNNHLIPHDKNQYKSNLFIAKFIFNKYLIPKNKIPTFLPKIFKTAIIIPIYIIFLSKLPFIKK